MIALAAPDDVGTAAVLACLLEASAPKPGNVAPGVHFRDTRYEDFLASAAAIGPALARAADVPLGDTIRAAVDATSRWTRANTNLGIVLLLAPLARAALLASRRGPRHALPLRVALQDVLASTTVHDAAQAYKAIHTAHPGGLGTAPDQDIETTPTVTLAAAMGLARDRDDVAREYATGFAITFDVAVPALRAARAAGLDWTLAVVEAYLSVLAQRPDTLIARKLGSGAAGSVSARAAECLALGGVRTAAGQAAVAAFDAELRDPDNARNPGTTADLTAAAIFVLLLEGGWPGAREGAGS